MDKVELALKMSTLVHDICPNVAHDIGLRLLTLVEEYEQSNMASIDDDGYDDDDDRDDWEEREEERLAEIAETCTCGAWQFNETRTKVFHVADCCCGAE